MGNAVRVWWKLFWAREGWDDAGSGHCEILDGGSYRNSVADA